MDSLNTEDWKVTLNLNPETIIGHVDDSGSLTSFGGYAEYSVYQYIYLYGDGGSFSRSTNPLRDFRHASTDSDSDTFEFHINPYSADFDYPDDLDVETFNPTSGRFTLQFSAHSSAYEAGDPVPVPGAVWLLGSGILSLLFYRRKRLN